MGRYLLESSKKNSSFSNPKFNINIDNWQSQKYINVDARTVLLERRKNKIDGLLGAKDNL